MRRFVRQVRDGNHKELVDFLRGHNFEVVETFRPLDCLVYSSAGTGWLEIKTQARNAPIQRNQIEFMANTKMPVAFVKTIDEAFEFAQTMKGITPRQKEHLAVFLETATRTQYHPAVIERVLNWK